MTSYKPTLRKFMVTIAALASFSTAYSKEKPIPNTVSLTSLFQAALQSSDAKVAKNRRLEAKASLQTAQSRLSPTLSISASQLDSEKDPTNSFSPSSLGTSSQSISLAKYFTSGTSINLSLSRSKNDLVYSANPVSNMTYDTTTITASLKQSLYKDMFGSGSRSKIEAAKISAIATRHQINQMLNAYLMETKNLFYQFKLLRLDANNALKSISEQQKLVEVTKVKTERGTAEKSELLQTKTALYNAQVHHIEARQLARSFWKKIITNLGLPKSWKTANFNQLKLVSPIITLDVQQACATAPETLATKSEQYQAALHSYESSKLSLVAAKYQDRGDFYAEYRVQGNGLDESASESNNEATGLEKPERYFGLGASFTFGPQASSSQVSTARQRKLNAKLKLSDLRANLAVDIENNCQKLTQMQRSSIQYLENAKLGREIVDLEKKRYQVGKADISQVINAINQRNRFELVLKKHEFDVSSLQWDIFAATRSLDGFKKFL